MSPNTDVERWVVNELNPLLKSACKQFGEPVDRLAIAVMSRRLAIAGVPLDSILDEVTHHYEHQINFIERTQH